MHQCTKFRSSDQKCTPSLVGIGLQALMYRFDDCIKLRRRLDERPYLLPNPTVLEGKVDVVQNVKTNFAFKPIEYYNTSSVNELPKRSGIFLGQRFFLSHYLGVSVGLRQALESLILGSDGLVTKSLEKANVLIGEYREGDEYVTASREGYTVGNIAWLYAMFSTGKYINPVRNLLHYPVCRTGLEGMQGKIISVTNYTGDARIFLQKLIEASGATFTRNMRQENTHLIAARDSGEKAQAARDWDVTMVNHLWLEESYRDWTVHAEANERYISFPPNSNLMEIIGTTSIDLDAIRNFFEDDSTRNTHTTSQPVFDAPGKPLSSAPDQQDADRSTNGEHLSPRYQTANPTDSRAVTPSSTASRKAKMEASAKLHESIVPDLNQYEEERQDRSGGKRRQRKPTSDKIGSPPKRSKPEEKERDQKLVRLVITGWVGKFDTDSQETCESIGIELTDDYASCTHLAAPAIQRTEKFVCAIARGPIVVNLDWIRECLRQRKVIETSKFLLKDPDGEQKYGCVLEESLGRARKGSGVFGNCVIYVTPSIRGGTETMARVIQSNGGVCRVAEGRRSLAGLKNSNDRLFLISTPEDTALWGRFQRRAAILHARVHLYSTEWVLVSVIRQTLLLDNAYALEP